MINHHRWCTKVWDCAPCGGKKVTWEPEWTWCLISSYSELLGNSMLSLPCAWNSRYSIATYAQWSGILHLQTQGLWQLQYIWHCACILVEFMLIKDRTGQMLQSFQHGWRFCTLSWAGCTATTAWLSVGDWWGLQLLFSRVSQLTLTKHVVNSMTLEGELVYFEPLVALIVNHVALASVRHWFQCVGSGTWDTSMWGKWRWSGRGTRCTRWDWHSCWDS